MCGRVMIARAKPQINARYARLSAATTRKVPLGCGSILTENPENPIKITNKKSFLKGQFQEKIYTNNNLCASCHKLDRKLIGPALAGVTERRENDWLKSWIKNNAALRASGDKDAIAIFNEYNGSVMSAFPQLSDAQIDDILYYTEVGDPKPVVASGPDSAPGNQKQSPETKNQQPETRNQRTKTKRHIPNSNGRK